MGVREFTLEIEHGFVQVWSKPWRQTAPGTIIFAADFGTQLHLIAIRDISGRHRPLEELRFMSELPPNLPANTEAVGSWAVDSEIVVIQDRAWCPDVDIALDELDDVGIGHLGVWFAVRIGSRVRFEVSMDNNRSLRGIRVHF